MGLLDKIKQNLGLTQGAKIESKYALPAQPTKEGINYITTEEPKTGVFIFKDTYERLPWTPEELYRDFIGLEAMPIPDYDEDFFVYAYII